MEKYLYKRRAAYYETDRMQIVHHSNYIRFFEEARISFMHHIGCDVKELENFGIIIPNVDAYAKYLKPIGFYDEFEIEINLTEFNGVKMVFEYKLRLCKTNEIATTGYTTHCFTTNNLKPVSIKRKFPNYYNTLKNWCCTTRN